MLIPNPKREKLKDIILKIIHEMEHCLMGHLNDLPQIVYYVKTRYPHEGFTESEIRQVTWGLIDCGKLVLDEDRMLRSLEYMKEIETLNKIKKEEKTK